VDDPQDFPKTRAAAPTARIRSVHGRLDTTRLTLLPVTPELLVALREHERVAELTGAAVPDGWPDDELAALLAQYEDWVAADESVVGYGPWLVVVRDRAAVAGSAGFVGKPNEHGEIELGYGIHPAFRNRGYASEAARALVDWGLTQPGVERVLATCDAENHASIRVLEKTGLRRSGRRGGQLLWASTRVPSAGR
jgi:RimJ/RimL family protein N-acetyltransferase